ncbi:gamma-glutamylcyclotransferase [Cohnella sp. GCM10020058]|uniref:gamma-glutamylcyclotransferase family protein n=1 Tax=Cohnella sp. GCM10020058 TaxID=3317330 RepID=UPI00362E01A9
MNSDLIKVFVYGTLMTGERNHHVIRNFVENVNEGSVQARLVNAGAFPAVLLSENDQSVVRGQWITIRSEGLKATDRLEGYEGPNKQNFYDRVWISDISNEHQGWIYIWKHDHGLPEIVGGSWKDREIA